MNKKKFMFFLNNRGDESLFQNLIPIILVVMFVAGGIFAITRIGSQVTIYEQTYAKEIALAIDKAEPGTTITIDITKLYTVAEKNKFPYESMIKIDNNEDFVWVRLITGKGYKFYFYNNAPVVWNMKDERLYLQIG